MGQQRDLRPVAQPGLGQDMGHVRLDRGHAHTGRAAGATGTMLLLALTFFAGLWIPQAQMPAALRHVSTDTPLGAAVAALEHSLYGQWPSLSGLALLAGYALIAGLLAWRFFRWE
jgi:ABC-2 type transport system permease protein